MLTNRLLVESTIKCRKCSAKTNWKFPFASQLIKTKSTICRDLLRECGSWTRAAEKKSIKIEENIWKTVTKVNDKVNGTIYARQELLRCRRKSIFSLAATATLPLCLVPMKICSNFKLTAWPGPTKPNTLKQRRLWQNFCRRRRRYRRLHRLLPHTNTHVEQGKENKKSFSSKVSISRFCWVKSLDTFAMYYFTIVKFHDPFLAIALYTETVWMNEIFSEFHSFTFPLRHRQPPQPPPRSLSITAKNRKVFNQWSRGGTIAPQSSVSVRKYGDHKTDRRHRRTAVVVVAEKCRPPKRNKRKKEHEIRDAKERAAGKNRQPKLIINSLEQRYLLDSFIPLWLAIKRAAETTKFIFFCFFCTVWKHSVRCDCGHQTHRIRLRMILVEFPYFRVKVCFVALANCELLKINNVIGCRCSGVPQVLCPTSKPILPIARGRDETDGVAKLSLNFSILIFRNFSSSSGLF